MDKLAIIVRSAKHGGIESHVYNLISNIDRNHFQPVLVSLVDEPVAQKFVDLKIDIMYAKDKWSMSYRSFINIYHLYKLLREISPDIVHCHGTRPIFVGCIAAFFAGIKHRVLTVHNSCKLMAYDGYKYLDKKKLIISKLMHYVGFFLASRIIFVSEYLLKEFVTELRSFPMINRLVNNKSIVIYNGVDTKKFFQLPDRHEIKKKLGIEYTGNIIGYVGRLDPNKNVELLITAAKNLIDNNIDCELIIIGEGYYVDELELHAKILKIDKHVHFLGHQDNLTEYYNVMDVFVLPSNSEGFALVIIEAMACHVPVISTDVGIAETVIKERRNGIIIEKNNLPELVAALNKLLTDKEYSKEVSESGAELVAHLFDQKKITQKISSQYAMR